MVEVDVQRCSVKKVFLEILQNSQENTCARVSFLIKLQASDCSNFRFILNLPLEILSPATHQTFQTNCSVLVLQYPTLILFRIYFIA